MPKEKVKPLEHPVNAEQHTPIYKMHRYYARRPWNVFEHIIKHYTDEGDIILDPFCGGGVTVVEGLKLKRKVIGVDLNPLATYVTKMEVEPLDIEKFKEAFDALKKKLEKEILPLYKTKCRKCGNANTYAEWYEWSNVFECPNCGKHVIVDEAKKVSPGTYLCTNDTCSAKFKPSAVKKIGEVLLRLYYNCKKCKHSEITDVNSGDKRLFNKLEKNFDEIIKKEKLWFPKDKFPDGDRERDDALSKKGILNFYHFFTKRNLIANSRLLNLIKKSESKESIKDFLYLCFGASLRFSTNLAARNENWRGGNPEWAGHAYWAPNIFCELNAFDAFIDRYSALEKGKKYSNHYINGNYKPVDNYIELLNKKTCWLLTQSSHKLPLPDNSIDVLITDPPFGGNVQYAELSDFWVVWLQDYLGVDGIIDNSNEAIQTRHSGFETEKDERHYEDMLYKIFKECHRVLKKDGYMVLTFHNKDINVWMSLHRAANRAGFRLPSQRECENRGIIYQPPIRNYTQTFHQKATGSMLGDFILTFKRMDNVTDESKIKSSLTKKQEIELENKIAELIEFHGGADDNVIMTILIPTLQELGIFTRVASFDWSNFLEKRFLKDKDTGKWFTKEHFDPATNVLRPIDFIPAEDVTREIIVSYLRDKKRATIDELLTEIYTKLVNSHRPGIEAIQKVMHRFCDESDKKGYKKRFYGLKRPSKSKDIITKEKYAYQIGMFGHGIIADSLSHNEIITILSNCAFEYKKKVHIGETEQRKEKKFKKISVNMLYKEDWGIASQKGFKKIKEIDLLILDRNEIPAAFEVTTSIDTAREAINDRFRELFTILPNTNIKAYVVVKKDDYNKAMSMLNTEANKKDGLNKKIKVIKYNTINKRDFIKWIEN